MQNEIVVSLMFLMAAFLYSSVGHAGASGYLAVMALMGFSPDSMRPMALTLNVVVASIATFKFWRAGCFSWRIFWPFAITSIPFSYLGGGLSVPDMVYKPLVGCTLLYAAIRLLFDGEKFNSISTKSLHPLMACLLGSVIGLLSGLTGVGGGIFLTPLLLFMGWAQPRQAAGVSALFILVNSLSALSGMAQDIPVVLPGIGFHIVAVVIGGLIGSEYGSRHFSNPTLRKILAVVLVIAGGKMLAVLI
jgi:uncharacterized membrane protein YfcA